ncbi:MAG: amidohydrolase family protein [Spirochaetes bacterium]|nr:amidohydrolase family protein [Spirochaetota bacterium]
MEIVDAHIHIFTGESRADSLARRAGHENTEEHMRTEYARLGLVGAVVMSNRTLALDAHDYPDFLRYCIGLDSFTPWVSDLKASYDLVEGHLQKKACVGIKIYPGYIHRYVWDEAYFPVYELAARYGKPVAIHTGETATATANLKYCHPLTLDELAAAYQKTNFVMCHFGNPWFVDAAAVINKNENVSVDLSGILEGKQDMADFFKEKEGYVEQMRTWISYTGAYDRFMFGTDWPLANIENYIDFIKYVIPEKHHEKVFAGNARRIYNLDF